MVKGVEWLSVSWFLIFDNSFHNKITKRSIIQGVTLTSITMQRYDKSFHTSQA